MSESRFAGIDRLYGKGSVGRLNRAHVAVIGLGGVGFVGSRGIRDSVSEAASKAAALRSTSVNLAGSLR